MSKAKEECTQAEAAFLPLVSHDIKSLSTAILTASTALSAKLAAAPTGEQQEIRELVQLLMGASNNLTPYIDDLVAYAKLNSDSATIKPAAVYNLRQELECARDTFSYEARAKQVDLSLSFTDEIPVVFCDITNLRVCALNNILSNALQHTPAGGKVAIVVSKPNDQTMCIKISDSGIGVHASERTGMFRQYLKSSKAVSSIGKPRGIGLHNASLSVKAHNGTLTIADEPGVSGTTFKMEIPLFSGCMQ